MTATIGMRPTGLQITKDGVTVPYRVLSASDYGTANALAWAMVPSSLGGYFRKDIRLTDMGGGTWDADAEYAEADQKDPESYDCKWTFDTSGKTKHITQGLQHIATYPASDAPFNHKGAIGVTADSVEGVDIPDKGFKWTETWYLPSASFGFAYAAVLGELRGSVNASMFRMFPAYTVLFDGATGGSLVKKGTLREFSFSFDVSPSRSKMSVGEITGIDKKGWDYLWVRYETKKNSTLSTTALSPVQVEIDRVFTEFNFSLLGIGTRALL